MGTSNETIRPDKRMVSATNFYDLQVEQKRGFTTLPQIEV